MVDSLRHKKTRRMEKESLGGIMIEIYGLALIYSGLYTAIRLIEKMKFNRSDSFYAGIIVTAILVESVRLFKAF